MTAVQTTDSSTLLTASSRVDEVRAFQKLKAELLGGKHIESLRQFQNRLREYDTEVQELLGKKLDPRSRSSIQLQYQEHLLTLWGIAATQAAIRRSQSAPATAFAEGAAQQADALLRSAKTALSDPLLRHSALEKVQKAVEGHARAIRQIAVFEHLDAEQSRHIQTNLLASEISGSLLFSKEARQEIRIEELIKQMTTFADRAQGILHTAKTTYAASTKSAIEGLQGQLLLHRDKSLIDLYGAINDRQSQSGAIIKALANAAKIPGLETALNDNGATAFLNLEDGSLRGALNPLRNIRVGVVPTNNLETLRQQISALPPGQRDDTVALLATAGKLSATSQEGLARAFKISQLLETLEGSAARVNARILKSMVLSSGGDGDAALTAANEALALCPQNDQTAGTLLQLAVENKVDALLRLAERDKNLPAEQQRYVPQLLTMCKEFRATLSPESYAELRLNYAKGLLESGRNLEAANELNSLLADPSLKATKTRDDVERYKKQNSYSGDSAQMRELFSAIQGQDWRLQTAVYGGLPIIGGLIGSAVPGLGTTVGASAGVMLAGMLMIGNGYRVGRRSATEAFQTGLSSITELDFAIDIGFTALDLFTSLKGGTSFARSLKAGVSQRLAKTTLGIFDGNIQRTLEQFSRVHVPTLEQLVAKSIDSPARLELLERIDRNLTGVAEVIQSQGNETSKRKFLSVVSRRLERLEQRLVQAGERNPGELNELLETIADEADALSAFAARQPQSVGRLLPATAQPSR
jgi:hypothetical protein